METATIAAKEAKVTAEPVGNGAANGVRGDYTRYFYTNIDRLWDAVQELQQENNRLKDVLKETSDPQSIIGKLKIVYAPEAMPKITDAVDVYGKC